METKKTFNKDKIEAKIIKEEKYFKGLQKLLWSEKFSSIQEASFSKKIDVCRERIKKLNRKLKEKLK